MAKKKGQRVENPNWKKIDTDQTLVFEEAGFLGLEEIDEKDYFLTSDNAKKIEQELNKKQKQQPQQQQKPQQNKNKKRKSNKDSDDEYEGFEDSDNEEAANNKKQKIYTVDQAIDVSKELLGDFVEGSVKHKKKNKKGLKVKQIKDEEMKESEEVKQVNSKQPQQQKQNNNNNKVKQQQQSNKEENETEEPQQEEEDETKIKKEKKVKTEQEIKTTQRNIQKIEKIKKRKEVSELKTISTEEQNQLDMSEWTALNLDPLIIKGLRSLGFEKPTEIQSAVLPVAISNGYDIIGAAQTGSGKTLAFGIPMVQRILQHLRKHGQSVEKEGETRDKQIEEEGDEEEEEEEESTGRSEEHRKLYSLVICPTRELAIQVTNHIKSIIAFTNLKVVSIVGGLAQQRQQRILTKRPEIVVATPGRLWELITEGHKHLIELNSLLCLGIDEADRMVEQGHFAELENILKTLPTFKGAVSKKERLKKQQEQEKRNKRRQVEKLNSKGEVINKRNKKGDEEDQDDQEEEDDEEEEEEEQEEEKHLTTTHKRQSFVFSATLVNIPGDNQQNQHQKKKYRKPTPIEQLIERVRFQRDYKLIDCTMKRLTAKNLMETKIFCNLEEKDHYLYYFVERYPGRTLVFVNSIDCARRLIPIFNILEVPVFSLHAQMQQKQRLKNLDRFRTMNNVVLIATDVAARGLDIPGVQHVIHYQVPRTTQTYIHRSGRTARSTQDGISVVLVTPKERPLYIKLDSALEHDIGNFPIDLRYLEGIRDRISLAREIDQLSYKSIKENREKSWYKKAAEEMDIELDPDFFGDDSDDDETEERRVEEHKKANKAKALRFELKQLLSKSLLPRGSSQSYVTATAIQELEEKSNSSATVDFGKKAKNVIGKKQLKAKKQALNQLTLLKKKKQSI
ncbi:hypothetical protein DICPUDRAFT_150880 [Dictyostelium purpureum]|uniref:ATP-dependent RNA helicase n=1 Tax=Dictyostelium purpureum TaxID=5786 RepID=F0ZHH4_DICPU|nr:uncharacterized protein DICPUDRAFT_150880 [Dictyostelium purpureum]EGC36632.1 hypothetical protein DICPUDRAFT_150880 [Dictyostelium purpureum]|eukprot:XP_003286870.1 hypothetical protein DICPUDRAFT_150880 [Dictyostelium purpureum]